MPYGGSIQWIGGSLHPDSGIWLSKAIALDVNIDKVAGQYWKDKNQAILIGMEYNHSSYCDLVISGLVGLDLEMNEDGSISVDSLIPEVEWDFFVLDGIQYRGKAIAVVFDKYGVYKGLSILVDGKRNEACKQTRENYIGIKIMKWRMLIKDVGFIKITN
tara:strand:- start:1589 stop:2068 length:480 start_codon:yes stop_codon:yes gene_type:complete